MICTGKTAIGKNNHTTTGTTSKRALQYPKRLLLSEVTKHQLQHLSEPTSKKNTSGGFTS